MPPEKLLFTSQAAMSVSKSFLNFLISPLDSADHFLRGHFCYEITAKREKNNKFDLISYQDIVGKNEASRVLSLQYLRNCDQHQCLQIFWFVFYAYFSTFVLQIDFRLNLFLLSAIHYFKLQVSCVSLLSFLTGNLRYGSYTHTWLK